MANGMHLIPLDGMRCHLAGTLVTCVVPSNIVLDRGLSPPKKGDIWGRDSESPVDSDVAYCQITLVLVIIIR